MSECLQRDLRLKDKMSSLFFKTFQEIRTLKEIILKIIKTLLIHEKNSKKPCFYNFSEFHLILEKVR
jgi:hypothetical protein